MAVDHVRRRGDGFKERIRRSRLRRSVLVNNRRHRGDRELRGIHRLLCLHPLLHIGIAVRQLLIMRAELADIERALVIRLVADDAHHEIRERFLRLRHLDLHRNHLPAITGILGLLEIDIRRDVDDLRVLGILRIDLCLELPALRHVRRTIIEIIGNDIRSREVDGLLRRLAILELDLRPGGVRHRRVIDIHLDGAAELRGLLHLRLALVRPFAAVLPAVQVLLELPVHRLRCGLCLRDGNNGEIRQLRQHGRHAQEHARGQRQRDHFAQKI